MNSKLYDIILVFGFFRIHNHYLNIVKYLAADYRIGVYVASVHKRGSAAASSRMTKVEDTDELFLACLQSFGADIIHDGRYECGLLVMPQVDFHPDFIAEIDRSIKRNNSIALQTFGYGMQMLKKYSELGINKFFVYDKVIFANKLTDEDRAYIKDNYEIAEMGCPFRQYPVFDGIEIDYMIAYPTALLLKDPCVKSNMLKNIIKLLDKMDAQDRVVLKLHNVKDNGNRIFNSYSLSSRASLLLAGSLRAASGFSRRLTGKNRVTDKIVNFSNNLYHSRIEKESLYLSSLTPYFNFGLELFLPFVKKGLLTGISSSIWYALHNKVAVFNCDDQQFTEEGIINSDTYKSFYVSPCKGKLEFSPDEFRKVPDSAREADLIEIIRHHT